MTSYSQNLILNSLPKDELDLLLPSMQRTSIKAHDILVEPGERIKDVFFPLSCMISLVTLLDNGVTIESATIGNEGMSGLSVFHGLDESNARAIVQMEGETYKLSTADFRDVLSRAPVLSLALGRYADALISMLAQIGRASCRERV